MLTVGTFGPKDILGILLYVEIVRYKTWYWCSFATPDDVEVI